MSHKLGRVVDDDIDLSLELDEYPPPRKPIIKTTDAIERNILKGYNSGSELTDIRDESRKLLRNTNRIIPGDENWKNNMMTGRLRKKNITEDSSNLLYAKEDDGSAPIFTDTSRFSRNKKASNFINMGGSKRKSRKSRKSKKSRKSRKSRKSKK